MQQKSELPEGWSFSIFSEFIVHALGGDWGKEPNTSVPEGMIEVNVIRGTEFKKWNSERGLHAVKRIVKKSSLVKRSLKKNDIVIEISGGGPDQPVGRTLIIDEKTIENSEYPLVCSNFCRQVRLSTHLNANYANLALEFQYNNGLFNKYQTQTTNIRNLQFQDFISGIKVPLPPLPEQNRIVSAIEALFSRLDATNEKLDKMPEILKKLRESVLVAAFEGRLTEEWRVECIGDIKWNWQNINEIGIVSGGLIKNQKRLNHSIKLPYLRVANVYANHLELDEMKEIGVLEEEINRYSLEEGDLLVVEGNGSIDQIGRVALWDGSIKPCLHQNHIIKVRFSHDVYNKYVLYWLLSPMGRENITSSSSSTSGLNTLSISKVGKLPVPLPPLPEQQEIVRRVDALFAFADSIEAKVAASREKTGKLRQSILAKAFSGELVETEAEIARREGRDYETAEVLIGRIIEGRSKSGKKR